MGQEKELCYTGMVFSSFAERPLDILKVAESACSNGQIKIQQERPNPHVTILKP